MNDEERPEQFVGNNRNSNQMPVIHDGKNPVSRDQMIKNIEDWIGRGGKIPEGTTVEAFADSVIKKIKKHGSSSAAIRASKLKRDQQEQA